MCRIKSLLESRVSGYQLHATAARKRIWFLVVFIQLVRDLQQKAGIVSPLFRASAEGCLTGTGGALSNLHEL